MMAVAPKTNPQNVGKGARLRRRAEALEAALKADVEPIFPYPDDLPEEYKATWRWLVNLKPAGYWEEGDTPLIWLYCRAVCDMRRLDEELKEEGEVIETGRGTPLVNPKVMVRNQAEMRFLNLCTKLRIGPTNRSDTKAEGNAARRAKSAKEGAATLREDEMGGDGLLAH